MHHHRSITFILVVLLAACTSAPEPTNHPTPAFVDQPSVLTSPAPTTRTLDATAPAPASRIGGTAGFHDQFAVADQFFLTLTNVPPPPGGQVYQAWLLGDDGTINNLGILTPASDSSVALIWNSPTTENLLRKYVQVQVTLEPEQGSANPTGMVVVAGGLEGEQLTNARRLLVANTGELATPRNTAYALGLRAETDLAVQHMQNAINAAAIGAQPEMRAHLEHIVNILDGMDGQRYGDHDGNGTAENPGDGFGVVGYTGQIAQILAGEPAVNEASAGIGTQSAMIQDRCLEILKLNDMTAITVRLNETRQLADQLQWGPVAQLYQAVQDSVRFEVVPVKG